MSALGSSGQTSGHNDGNAAARGRGWDLAAGPPSSQAGGAWQTDARAGM